MNDFDSIKKERLRYVCDALPESFKSMLDVGFGNGQFLKCISSSRRLLCGIDIVIKNVPSKGIYYIKGDIFNLPVKDRSFDVSVCLEVLEHLQGKIEHAIAELSRVSGSNIIISIPWRECIVKGLVFCPQCKKQYHMSGHQRSFDDIVPIPDFTVISSIPIIRIRPKYQFGPLYRVTQRFFHVYAYPGGEYVKCPYCGMPALNEEQENNSLKRVINKMMRSVITLMQILLNQKDYAYMIYSYKRTSLL